MNKVLTKFIQSGLCLLMILGSTSPSFIHAEETVEEPVEDTTYEEITSEESETLDEPEIIEDSDSEELDVEEFNSGESNSEESEISENQEVIDNENIDSVEEEPVEEPTEIIIDEEQEIGEIVSVDPIKDGLDFSSRRLMVISEGDLSEYPVIGSYDGIFLLQFETISEAQQAYDELVNRVIYVTPDIEFSADEESETEETDTETEPIVMTVQENPLMALSAEMESVPEVIEETKTNEDKLVVALIDSGAPLNGNVIASISVIGDSGLDDNGHGTRMAEFLTQEFADIQILSIKALDSNGKGSASSIYSALEYAIEQNVDVINLSLSAYSTAENKIISDAIDKATSQGIIVVGSAGNNGIDSKYFIPGNISSATIATAAKSDFTLRENANYGDLVDYMVIAESGSEAAARLSGKIIRSLSETGYPMLGLDDSVRIYDLEIKDAYQPFSLDFSDDFTADSDVTTFSEMSQGTANVLKFDDGVLTRNPNAKKYQYNYSDGVYSNPNGTTNAVAYAAEGEYWAPSSGAVAMWAPDAGTYQNKPFGMEIILEALDSADSDVPFRFRFKPTDQLFTGMFIEGAKLYKTTIRFYKNVPANSTKPAGDPLVIDTKSAYVLVGPKGITHEGRVPSGNSMVVEESEFMSPIPANEPVYTYSDNTGANGSGTPQYAISKYGNSDGNPNPAYKDILMHYSVYNNGVDYVSMLYNTAMYMNVRGKSEIQFYVGITGSLDLDRNAAYNGNRDDFKKADPTIYWSIGTISNWYKPETTITTIDDPSITKYIYNPNDETLNEGDIYLFEDNTFDYYIDFTLPPQTEGGWYAALEVVDNFDSLLDLSGVSGFTVVDENNADVSNLFDINFNASTRSLQVVAKEDTLKYISNGDSPYYGRTYRIIGRGFKKIPNATLVNDSTQFNKFISTYRIPNKSTIRFKKATIDNPDIIDTNFRTIDSNEVAVRYKHWLKINYREVGTEKILYTQEFIDGYDGTSITIGHYDPSKSYGLNYSVPSPDLKDGSLLTCPNPNNYGYSLVDENDAVVTGTMDNDFVELDVYYYPHKLVINYLEEGTDVVLWQQYVDPSKTTNEAYSVKSPVIQGYELVEPAFATVSDVMDAPVKEHTVYYRKTPMIGNTLTVYKSANPESQSYVDPGQQITYTLRAENTGATTVTAGSYVVTDVLPENVTFVSADSGLTYDEATRTVTWTNTPQIASGGSASKSFKVKVNSGEKSFIYNSANWTFKGSEHQTNEVIHRLTDSGLVGPAALESVKSSSLQATRSYVMLDGTTTTTRVRWYTGAKEYTWKTPVAGKYTFEYQTNTGRNRTTANLAAGTTITISGSGTPSDTRIVLSNGEMCTIKLPITTVAINKSFDYTGTVQQYTLPSNAREASVTVNLEVKGAAGGNNINSNNVNTRGGSTTARYVLTRGSTLYVVVGQAGLGYGSAGPGHWSYNGGTIVTNSYGGGGGGGATHIATTNRGELYKYKNYQNDVLIVAGGGGGTNNAWNTYSSAVNARGGSGAPNQGPDPAHGSVTVPGEFGRGPNLLNKNWGGQATGGGGGWAGGAAGSNNDLSTTSYNSGGGGTGYANTSRLVANSVGGTRGGGNSGNGSARIYGASYTYQETQTVPTVVRQNISTGAVAGSGTIEVGGAVSGNQITYTVTLGNNGGSPSIGTVLTDEIPAGTTFTANSISYSTTGTVTGAGTPTYNATTKRVEWYLGTMEPNATATLTFKVDAAKTGVYLIANQARYGRGVNKSALSSTEPMHASNIVEYVVTGSLPVVKQWVGDSATDRPNSITVHLVSTDGTVDTTATLNAANGWQANFSGLNTTKSYRIYEDVPAGYTSSADSLENAIAATFGTANVITNTKIPNEERTITVIKKWTGSADLPASVTLHLVGSDGSHRQETVTLTDNWSYTFSGLPYKTSAGAVIEYSVYETSTNKSNKFIYAHEGSANSIAVASTMDPVNVIVENIAIGTINIPVKKVWVPAEESNRYESIDVGLYDSSDTLKQRITLYKSENWEGKFTGIPTQDANGAPIDLSTYTVREIGNYPRFTSSVSGDASTGFTITNELTTTTKYKHIRVVKNWVDDGTTGRPTSITIHIVSSTGQNVTKVLSATNNWEFYGYFDAETPDGTEITYRVYEENPGEMYSSSNLEANPVTANTVTTEVSWNETVSRPEVEESRYTTTITNTRRKDQLVVMKNWSGEEPEDVAMRPDSITLHIVGSDGSTITKTLTGEKVANNTWSAVFEVPRYSATGDVISYTVWESGADDYDGPNTLDLAEQAQYTPSLRTYTVTLNNELVLDYPVSKKVFNDNDVDIDGQFVLHGNTLHYVIYVTNPMSSTKKFDVEDVIPENTHYVANSANFNGVYDSTANKLTWTDVEIAAGETAEVRFNVTVDEENAVYNTIINYADVWMKRSNGDRNDKTHKLTNEVTNYLKRTMAFGGNDDYKTVTDLNDNDIDTKYVEQNDRLKYHIFITNYSASAKVYTVTDNIPENTTFVEVLNNGTKSGNTVRWTVTIEPHETVELCFIVYANQASSDIVNRAHIAVDEIEWDTNEVHNQTAVIRINKSITEYYEPFGTAAFIYKITDSNGNISYRMIEVNDTLTGTTEFVVPRNTPNSVTYTVEELPNGRYQFKSVSTTTDTTTTISGEKEQIRFSVGNRLSVGSYINEIVDWDKASHADAVINSVPTSSSDD